jgi:peptidoglycan/xylan/chitin deacetylase (PgdA/CDA1 family)
MTAQLPQPATRRGIGAALKATIAIHGVALLLLLWNWHYWPLSLAMIVANHLVLAVAGLLPRSTWVGANIRRLPVQAAAAGQVAITIDDGPDPLITPQVLELLDRFECKATFFCIGERVAAHADIAREIVRRGHQIENHTQRHRLYFSVLGTSAIRTEVLQGQKTIADAVGVAPQFFRAPAGLRNPLLDGILSAAGLRLVSWTRRGFDTVTEQPGVVLARLTRNLRAGDILLLHDGHAARTSDGSVVILRVLPDLLAAIRAAGLACVTLRAALQAPSGTGAKSA